jgi:hypothetical protein
MPPWLLKAGVQGALSMLPRPQAWNRLFQRYVTRSLTLTEDYFLQKWTQCARHIDHHVVAGGGRPTGFVAVELGTGWFPIIPIGLALSGARRVVTLDQVQLLAPSRVVAVLRAYYDQIARGTIAVPGDRPLEQLRELLAQSEEESAEGILARLGIEARVADARATGLADGSVDLFVSNNTFEHIPRDVLRDILREYRRLAAPGAVMSHFIDMSDHYAGFDKSIGPYHFLRFSSRTWRLFNNELQYQNRLRVTDFRELHAETGWRIVRERNSSRELVELRAIELAEEFRRYPEEELAVYASWMVSVADGAA